MHMWRRYIPPCTHQRMRQYQLLICLILALACLMAVGTASDSVAQGNCLTIYEGGNGWVIDMCATDPNIDTPMQVVMDGIPQGAAALVRIYHQAQDWPGIPQVAVIYASGFIRLKQNADPSPPIPFGSSFILGPAYWPDPATYHHHPQLHRLDIDTTGLPHTPLRMRAEGTNHDFETTYAMVLPPLRDRHTRLHVTQTYTATTNIGIDPTRRVESQGFKLVQVSSMFINQGGICDGEHTDCHDSNAARYIGADLDRHQVAFGSLTLPGFVFNAPQPLGSTWLDVLHTDNLGWQGNTPNARIALDALPPERGITPQGWIGVTTNPNDDNVNLWLHDDGPASAAWQEGERDQISYWLLAQDNPPEPWADLGLRSGHIFLDFEGAYTCFPVFPGPPVTAVVAPIAGYTDTALQLHYDLGTTNGNWAQIRCNFDPPLDLSAYDHLRFDWRGDPSAGNSLEIGLINPAANGEHIFARGYHHATHQPWWGQLVIPFSFLHAWTPNTSFNPSQISAFFVSVVKDPVDDLGGAGSLAIDNLNAFNATARPVPDTFEAVQAPRPAAMAAVNWLATQQQTTGFLKSWQEETICTSHVYDQALALVVFAMEGRWAEADTVVQALATAQNPEGSWFKSYDCANPGLPCVHCYVWEGDIAWAIYALSRYRMLGGTHPAADTTMRQGATWLAGRIDPNNGCLVIDHTEGTLDAWWALQAAGPDFADAAAGLKTCLLTAYWDDAMGRFKGGQTWQQPYLDNQTWGAAFLKAIGEDDKARRALSYARDVLRLPAPSGQLFGFDGQAGPWSVWNEGTGQYIAIGGEGAHDLLLELLAQQRHDGAMPGSPDEFLGGGVWTTRWHGVAPTAWLYNALAAEPFDCPHCGDVDGNRQITPNDALLAFQHFLGLAVLDACQQDYADVEVNRSITPGDALEIFKKFLGMSTIVTACPWEQE